MARKKQNCGSTWTPPNPLIHLTVKDFVENIKEIKQKFSRPFLSASNKYGISTSKKFGIMHSTHISDNAPVSAFLKGYVPI